MFVTILALNLLSVGTTFATILEPGFTAPIENVTAPLGREAVLACTVHNLNTYKVAWLRVDTQTILTIHTHVISRSRRVGVTHTDHRIWFLHIRELRETDRGWYMCQINTDPMKSQRGYLHVTVPPDILDEGTSGDVAVREGAVASLTCAVSGSPTPSLIWRREGNKPIRLANGTTLSSVEGSMLSLSAVSRGHAGGYLCIASNGVPPTVSKRITLTVEFPPVVTVRNHVVGAPLGTDLMLQCEIEAYPKPVVYWTKDNVEIFGPDSEPVKLESLYRGTMRLPIRMVSQADYGSYRCVAKNSLGDAEGAIKVYQISSLDVDRKSDAQRQNVVASSSTLFGSQDFRFLQNYNNVAASLESFKYILLVLVTLCFLLQI